MTVLHALAAHCEGDLARLVGLLDVLDTGTLRAARIERAQLPTPYPPQPLSAPQLDQQALADEFTAAQLDDLRATCLVTADHTLPDLVHLDRRASLCLELAGLLREVAARRRELALDLS